MIGQMVYVRWPYLTEAYLWPSQIARQSKKFQLV